MSIVNLCPYENDEHCKYEIYYGEPIFSKCKTCDRNKTNKQEGCKRMTHEEFLYQKYKAEQKWKQSAEYKIMKAVAIIIFIVAVVGSGIILFMGERI